MPTNIQKPSPIDIGLVVTTLSILFYCYILYLLLTAKSNILKSAFFRIYIVTGIGDILGIMALQWSRTELNHCFAGPSFELLTRVAMTSTGILFFTHIFGCLLMTANRFTAVRFPFQQEIIWSNRNLCAVLIIEIIISILIHIEALWTPLVYRPDGNGGWILVGRSGPTETLSTYPDLQSSMSVRIITPILTLVYEVVSIVLIAYTIYVMRQKLRQTGRKLTQDMGLVIMTALNCVMNLFESIYDFSFLLRIQVPFILWIKEQYNTNFFLLMTLNAFSMFFVCKTLRQEFLLRWNSTRVHLLQTAKRTRTRDTTQFGLK